MGIMQFSNESNSLDKYLLNPNILNLYGIRINRVHIFRIRSFIEELVFYLEKDLIYNKRIMVETLQLALSLMVLKKRYKVTLNEITLASLWITLRNNNISLNILKLIDISRKKLNKKITRKNIIKILSYVRNWNTLEDPKKEIITIGLNGIKDLMKQETTSIKRVLLRNDISKAEYFLALKREFLRLVSSIPTYLISGKPRGSIAAILLYIADKNISEKMNIKPILPAKKLSEIFDICQFTILRNYKRFLQHLY